MYLHLPTDTLKVPEAAVVSPDDCARLVNRITATWPTGVRGVIWTDVLRDLDYTTAREAYVRLRDTHDRPPSVKAFRDELSLVERQARRTATTNDTQPTLDEPLLAADDPRAITAFEREYLIGRAQLLAEQHAAGLTDDEIARMRTLTGLGPT